MTLITVRPGPVLHVWRDGAEVAAVPLSPSAALSVASDLLAAIAVQAGAQRCRPVEFPSEKGGPTV
jgi:hypothetical protein